MQKQVNDNVITVNFCTFWVLFEVFFYVVLQPNAGYGFLTHEVFRDATVGRTPLGK
jgi:hypothetical protein